jgi:hypothetical protein
VLQRLVSLAAYGHVMDNVDARLARDPHAAGMACNAAALPVKRDGPGKTLHERQHQHRMIDCAQGHTIRHLCPVHQVRTSHHRTHRPIGTLPVVAAGHRRKGVHLDTIGCLQQPQQRLCARQLYRLKPCHRPAGLLRQPPWAPRAAGCLGRHPRNLVERDLHEA